MGAAQIILIVLLALSVGMSLAKHGEPKGIYSFWAALANTAIWVGVLWWGGFWH